MFGAPGRRALEERLGSLRAELGADICVVNGENAADGRGLTPKLAERILAAGADVITLGNHTWARRELAPYLETSERVIRPANLSRHAPGRALAVTVAADGTPVAVVSLMGSLFLDVARGPFEVVDELVEAARGRARVIVVDFHAEATSEKIALGWHLDGRVTAVVGTHTHVPTADARVLPDGTAYITDVGMTGPRGGVIGVVKEQSIRGFVTHMNERYETSAEDPWLMGVVIRCSQAMRADAIEQVLLPAA